MDFLSLLIYFGVFLFGSVVGSLVTLCWFHPAIGRVLLRAIATVTLALGAALAVWPTTCMIRHERLRPITLPFPNSSIGEIGEAFGFSACFFVLGGMTLWFSFIVRVRTSEPSQLTPEVNHERTKGRKREGEQDRVSQDRKSPSPREIPFLLFFVLSCFRDSLLLHTGGGSAFPSRARHIISSS